MSDRTPAEIFPPGDFIREEIDARGWTQQDLADILGKPLPTVNQILKGKKGIVADTAQRLAAAFGNSAQFWMNLEASWRLHSQPATPETASVRSRAQIYDLAPIREMAKRGWIKRTQGYDELGDELRRFFGVDSLDRVPELVGAARASIKGEYAGMTAAQWTWCKRACQMAPSVDAKRFQRARIKDTVAELRALMCDPEEIRHVPKILSSIGIRLVIAQHLSRTRMDGAALWPSTTKPVIALSMRYGRLDHFWFTLMHELAHIYHRDGVQADVDLFEPNRAEIVDEAEARANKQAVAWLIDQDKLDSFVLRTTPLYSTQRIMNFSRRMGVHVAIVVGQLKFRKELEWPQFSRLQRVDVRSIVRNATICDGWGHVALADGQER